MRVCRLNVPVFTKFSSHILRRYLLGVSVCHTIGVGPRERVCVVASNDTGV
jgi:hypothetical protein